MTTAADPDAGFSLIEALVAVAVLAVATAGLVRAIERHIDAIAALEARTAGGWAADNALAEARLGLATADSTLLGRDWHPTVTAARSDDPEVGTLTVTATSGTVHVTMRGFRDTPAAPAEHRP